MTNSKIILYQSQTGEVKIDVRLDGETVWLSQDKIAQLFGVQRPAISKHLKNIFVSGELEEKVVCSILELPTPYGVIKGKTQNTKIKHYNLEAVLCVGYRVNSQQATQFRIWATKQLKEYITKGFVLNDERFKSGSSMNYFEELQNRIRKIRISERFFYQKIKDIYITSLDYDSKNKETIRFFKIIQNKLLWAISQKTAAELIYNRIDIKKPLLGLSSIGKLAIKKSDISIAKNYLNEKEIKTLGLLVEQYLAFAQTMAEEQTPMRMQDWIKRLDIIIKLNNKELLDHAGKISNKIAINKAKETYKQYQENQKKSEKKDSFKELESDIKKLKK